MRINSVIQIHEVIEQTINRTVIIISHLEWNIFRRKMGMRIYYRWIVAGLTLLLSIDGANDNDFPNPNDHEG